ncbi:ABC transporter ATP-binding protein [Clostridiaceae bacterium M8S5]|nr:ABC transporter ATP-binding protein [Clostridiaceae bacterium M8S5]
MNSIKTQNLSLGYINTTIIDKIDMKIPKGKITVIIGPNGCGKSTVLKALGRILKPKNGVVYLDGIDIKKLSTSEIARKMAILPQSPNAPSGLTVRELVSFGRFPHKRGFGKMSKEDNEAVSWALDVTRLTELETKEVDTLSGGQRQRAWISMAIAQKTDIILLDEPTTYLDMSYQLEILELLYRLNKEKGYTIAMVLHDINLAARHADYMIAIRDGKIICRGTPEDVMKKEVLRDTFQINAQIIQDKISGRPTCVSYTLAT